MTATVRALAADVHGGRTTPSAIARGLVDRLHGGPPPGPAWITLVPADELLAAAAVLDDHPHLPLAGVPFAVKDNIDVAGLPTTAACPGFAYVPDTTAPVVTALLDAGALLVGKTNLDQFATGLVGARSPYGACASVLDPRYVSGGSSSGSAVAVADGSVAFALGTDTAGSGRVPAAFNGIVGLKPTRGVLSTRGVVPASRSLDCVSLFTHDVADAALLLDLLAARPDPGDPRARRDGHDARAPSTWPADVRPPRFAIPDAAGLEPLDGAARVSWHHALGHATDALGASVRPIPLTAFREAAAMLYEGAWLAERYAGLADVLRAEPDGLNPIVAAVVAPGAAVTGADVFRAQARLDELRAAVRVLLDGTDALLLPTTPTTPTPADVAAAPIAINRRLGTYTNFVNLLDLCALALPVPGASGPPSGVTLVAEAGGDRTLLALADAWSTAPVPLALPQT